MRHDGRGKTTVLSLQLRTDAPSAARWCDWKEESGQQFQSGRLETALRGAANIHGPTALTRHHQESIL